MSRTLVLSLVLTGFVSTAVAAQSSQPRYDPVWHGSIGAAALVGAGLLVWSERDELPVCKWCGVDANGQPDAPGIDEWAESTWRRNGHEDRASTISHVTAGVSYAWPLIGLTSVHGGFRGEWARDQVVAIESLAVAQFAADAAKRAFRRARPAMVFDGAPAQTMDDVHSYFSGHTTTTFAAVVSTATIASRRGSRHATWIWIAGVGTASTTGYLRVAANRHFLTDILTGAAVGTTVGLVMPRLFDEARPATGEPVAAAPPPISGLGPVAHLGSGDSHSATLQFGAGARSVGIVGTVNLR